MRHKALLLAATSLTIAAAGACARDADVESADQRRCDAGSELSAAWNAFTDGEITAEDRDRLIDALAEVGHAHSEVAQAESQAGNNPLHEFNESIQDQPDDATLAERAEDQTVSFFDMLAGLKDLFVGRDCP
jgi:hypothetical protein